MSVALTKVFESGDHQFHEVGFDGPDFQAHEETFKNLALRKFPRHLLGVVPILCAGDLVEDPEPPRHCQDEMDLVAPID